MIIWNTFSHVHWHTIQYPIHKYYNTKYTREYLSYNRHVDTKVLPSYTANIVNIKLMNNSDTQLCIPPLLSVLLMDLNINKTPIRRASC